MKEEVALTGEATDPSETLPLATNPHPQGDEEEEEAGAPAAEAGAAEAEAAEAEVGAAEAGAAEEKIEAASMLASLAKTLEEQDTARALAEMAEMAACPRAVVVGSEMRAAELLSDMGQQRAAADPSASNRSWLLRHVRAGEEGPISGCSCRRRAMALVFCPDQTSFPRHKFCLACLEDKHGMSSSGLKSGATKVRCVGSGHQCFPIMRFRWLASAVLHADAVYCCWKCYSLYA